MSLRRLASKTFAFLLAWPALIALSTSARAADEQAPAPYFVTLKQEEVFMREGPSANNRVKWIYHRKGLPVEVIATYDVWRRVRDMDGEIGWVHSAMLSRDRGALVIGEGDAALREAKSADSDVVAEVEPGAVGELKSCDAAICEVKFAKAQGWMERSRLWGVHNGEKF